MTATVNGTRVPDVETVLKRADHKWAKNRADDPAPPEYLDALGLAVQQQIVDVLADAGAPAPTLNEALSSDLADAVERERRRADAAEKALAEQPAEDARVLQAQIDRLQGELDKARQLSKISPVSAELQLDLDALRSQVTALQGELDEARAERDTARCQIRDLEAGQHTTVTVAAVQEQSTPDVQAVAPETPHCHIYPLETPAGDPGPCSCGKEFPRLVLQEPGVDEPPDPDPWDAVLGRVRTELADWPGEVA